MTLMKRKAQMQKENNEELNMFFDKSILPGRTAVSMSDIAQNQ